MPVLFKDLEKEASDQLTKQFIGKDGTTWKVESKYKGAWDTLFINPQADGRGVTVDVEYNVKAANLKTKTNVSTALVIKPKVTIENGAHKVEVSTKGDVRDFDYEATYELKEKTFAANVKVTPKAAEGFATVSVAHHCVVGGGIDYDLTGGAKSPLAWAAGARYNRPGTTASLITRNLQTFSVALRQKFDLFGKEAHAAALVAQSKSGLEYAFGLEHGCFLGTGSHLKFRINNKYAIGAAIVKDFGDGWKAALGWESTNLDKFGLLLTRESK